MLLGSDDGTDPDPDREHGTDPDHRQPGGGRMMGAAAATAVIGAAALAILALQLALAAWTLFRR